MTRLRSSSTSTLNNNNENVEDRHVEDENVKAIDASDVGPQATGEDNEKDTEESTNGPYDSVMRDDPHVHLDDQEHEAFHDEHVEEDAYVSTIVPEYVTTLNPSMMH